MNEAPKLCTVTFEPSLAWIQVALGTVLRRAATEAGIILDLPCGGFGTCGRCTVVAEGSLEPPGTDETLLLSPADLAAGLRLACRARVAGDVTVRPVAPEPARQLRIVDGGDLPPGPVSIEPPERRGITGTGPLLGAVVDVGTTTLAASIVDLQTGARRASASALNPQDPFGHDVLSRVSHVARHGVDSLREPIVTAVEDLIIEGLSACKTGVEHLREVAIAGNPTIMHLLLGIDPASLGVAPYTATFSGPLERPAPEIGFRRLPGARAYVLPGASAFVGADVTAGLLATPLAEHDTRAMLIDLGTNGEIVLRTDRGLLAASTAAGPALEGASISQGMRAETGAIERVALEGPHLRLTMIGGASPRGLCGSGLLDLIAVLLDTGVLDADGRLRDDATHPLASRVSERDGVRVFLVAREVFLTQPDVRQVQLAVAAIAAGIDMLLEEGELAAEQLSGLIVAGGFGFHVQAHALVRMGMIPAVWESRVSFAGNTAMAGATIALLDSRARRRAEAIARHVTTVDLASRPDFQRRFVAALRFPRGAPVSSVE